MATTRWLQHNKTHPLSAKSAAYETKAPILCILASHYHRPPTWIFCNKIYHHYIYLHILVMLNEQAIGVTSIAMNTTLQTCLYGAQHPKDCLAGRLTHREETVWSNSHHRLVPNTPRMEAHGCLFWYVGWRA